MKVFIDVWKRPEHLLAVQPDIPMVILAGTSNCCPPRQTLLAKSSTRQYD